MLVGEAMKRIDRMDLKRWHSLLLLVLVTVHVGVRGTGHDLAGAERSDEGESCKLHGEMKKGYREEMGREKKSMGNHDGFRRVVFFLGFCSWVRGLCLAAACVFFCWAFQKTDSRRDAVSRNQRTKECTSGVLLKGVVVVVEEEKERKSVSAKRERERESGVQTKREVGKVRFNLAAETV
jgi:hypothetical protein